MVIIGIDLGTTNSSVAVFANGFPEVIQDETGKRLIPSIVTFTEEEILVGARAKSMAHSYPENTICDAKRFIGQRFGDKNVQRDITNTLYKVVNKDGRPYIKVSYKNEDLILSIEDVSAYLLKHIKTIAENRLNHPISEVVITVPAYFDDTQRTATKKAAQIANFKKIRIINEPTAAAIASQYNNKKLQSRKVLVYDFGGGTFDVSIVSVHGHNFNVITTDGDCYLGGKDIDENLIQHIIKIHNSGAMDKKKMRRFKVVCEDAKKELSFSKKHIIELENIFTKDYHITRREFEEINEELFQKTIELIDRSLRAAKLTANDIDEVVLVGGSSRIPRVRHLLQAKFPKSEMNTSINPDEAIALGAAIYGGQINGDQVELTIRDVLTHSIGIESCGGIMEFAIKRNKKLPCSKQITTATTKNFQASAVIQIYQGESLIASKNSFLGEFTVVYLKKEPRGKKVIIILSINEEGILKVTATEDGTDNSKELTISISDRIASTSKPYQVDYATHKEELRYVKFVKKLMTFFEYCEDLKYNYRDKLEKHPDILKNIEENIKEGESLKPEDIFILKTLEYQTRILKEKLQNVE